MEKDSKSKKLKLPQVTLAAMTSVNVRATIKAMQYSMRGIDFGDAVLITHRKPVLLPKSIRYSHTDRLKDIDAFNYKMVYELGAHIHTDFALIVMLMALWYTLKCGGRNFWTMIISVRLGRCRPRAIQPRTATATGISAVSGTAQVSAASA